MRKVLILALLSMFIGAAGCAKHEEQPAAPEASASAAAEASPAAEGSPAAEASPAGEASPAASPAAP